MSYEYKVKASTKEDLLTCIRYLLYYYDPDEYTNDSYKNDDDYAVEFEQGQGFHAATISIYNQIYMDLPNLYDNHEEFYEIGKMIVEEMKIRPFSFSFTMSDEYGNYFHTGDFKFCGGKHISYFDNASVDCVEPTESCAEADYVDGKFINEKLDFVSPLSEEEF